MEYDSGECPVCGQLNTELPCTTGIEPKFDDLIDDIVKTDIINILLNKEDDKIYSYNELSDLFKHLSDEDRKKISDCQFKLVKEYLDGDSGGVYCYLIVYKDRIYSYNELSDLLKHLSDEDRMKVSDCQFKLYEDYPDDDSGDIYYSITAYRNNNKVGKIDMQYNSNTYFDLIDMEIKTTDDTPCYTYTLTLNEDSKEDSKNPFDDTFGSSTNPFDNLYDNIKSPYDNSRNPFSSSKFRCKNVVRYSVLTTSLFQREGNKRCIRNGLSILVL